jgi:hypothetical protein
MLKKCLALSKRGREHQALSQPDRRDSQRDALLSSIDAWKRLQQLIQMAALPFERGFFDRVVAQWARADPRRHQAIARTRLATIELLTHAPANCVGATLTTAVIQHIQRGDSPARNLSVRLRPVGLLNGLQVVGADRTSILSASASVASRDVHRPNGLREAELCSRRVTMRRRSGENVSDRYSCRIAFFDAPSVYTPIHESPYIVVCPSRPQRCSLADRIFSIGCARTLPQNAGTVADYLWRTAYGQDLCALSIVADAAHAASHLYAVSTLQLYNYLSTIPEFLFELATQIWTRLTQAEIMLDEPNWDIYSANPHRAFRDFCDLLDRTLGEYRVLVMMDEFGVLMDKVRNKVFEASLFDYLRGLIQRSSTLSFLFTGAYEIRRMQQDYGSILFNMPKVLKISYLTTGEATELIQKPVEGLLSYHPLVINKIHEVTACHPYFVQYICDELVHLAQSERRNYVELTDLDYVIKNVAQDATGNIEHSIYDYLEHSEKLALAALANLTDEVRVFVPISDIAALLDRRHLGMSREEESPMP